MACASAFALTTALSAGLTFMPRAASGAETGKPSVEDLFRHPAMTAAVLSPNGKSLAVIMGMASGRDELAVIDLDDRKNTRIVAGFSASDVATVEWVNDERLVFTAHDFTGRYRSGLGLFAVNRDGADMRKLIDTDAGAAQTGTNIIQRTLRQEWSFYSTLRDGSDDVIVSRFNSNVTHTLHTRVLGRLNTRTRMMKVVTLDAPSDGIVHWILDHEGVPRVALTSIEGRSKAYWRDKEGSPWGILLEWDSFTGTGFLPFHLSRDGTLYVLATSAGHDTNELHRYDFAKHAIDPEPIISLPGFDLVGNFEVDRKTGKVLGLHYVSDASGSAWFDKDFAKIQERVDAALPGTINVLSCGNCESSPHVLVRSFSDRQPAVLRLYDRQRERLEPIGQSRPWLSAQQMGQSEFSQFKARDGLPIPVLVTYPPGPKKGPYPAVVLVHGGPYVRGSSWGWNPQAQFLANAGYVVIEPAFRGSTGLGRKHFEAGWKQWGLAMQDDVADAALWAAKQNIADRDRMCIAGASYGGYATLMGLAKNPELFKCGINWVGVTDIDLLYSINWSDTSEIYKGYGMPQLVGDRVKDKAQLDATSPILNAKKITQPLLMAYGRLDQRVPVEHGREFLNAVKPFNKNVEYIEYAEEGHGWRLLATDVDFWSRVERFLSRNIGSGAAH